MRWKTGIPDHIGFRTKPGTATERKRTVVDEGVPSGVVLGDAGCLNSRTFGDGITATDLTYIVGIRAAMTFRPYCEKRFPAYSLTGKGNPARLLTCNEQHQSVSTENLARTVGRARLRSATLGQGSGTPLTMHFWALHVGPTHHDYWRTAA